MKMMINAMEADWNYDQITIVNSSKGINDPVIMCGFCVLINGCLSNQWIFYTAECAPSADVRSSGTKLYVQGSGWLVTRLGYSNIFSCRFF
jgi:hypothetical protein